MLNTAREEAAESFRTEQAAQIPTLQWKSSLKEKLKSLRVERYRCSLNPRINGISVSQQALNVLKIGFKHPAFFAIGEANAHPFANFVYLAHRATGMQNKQACTAVYRGRLHRHATRKNNGLFGVKMLIPGVEGSVQGEDTEQQSGQASVKAHLSER